MATATYRFIVPGRYIGQTVTVFDQSTSAQVASGTVGSDGSYSVALTQGDYYATTPDGRYVDADSQGASSSDSANAAAAALSNAFAARVEPFALTLNADGSVATETVGGLVTTYTYNADGTLHTATRKGVTITYSYDTSGNMTGAA